VVEERGPDYLQLEICLETRTEDAEVDGEGDGCRPDEDLGHGLASLQQPSVVAPLHLLD